MLKFGVKLGGEGMTGSRRGGVGSCAFGRKGSFGIFAGKEPSLFFLPTQREKNEDSRSPEREPSVYRLNGQAK